MKLLIEISDKLYNFVKTKTIAGNSRNFDDYDMYDVSRRIANGTPLPKGHGRLIDAEELLQYGSCPDDCTGSNSPECDEVAHCPIRIFDIESINDAPTIIKADKEGETE